MKKILLSILMLIVLIACNTKEESKEIKENEEIRVLTLEEFQDKKDSSIVIDTRSYDEYNGWDTVGSGVEGHIPSSINIPANSIDESNLDETLERKKVSSEKEIILYGRDSDSVATILEEKGYEVAVFENGEKLWNENNLPLESLENKEIIVPISWVKDLLDGKKVKHYDGRPVMVFNAGWDETDKTHSNGHIPGSYWAHIGWVEEGPLWNRVSDDKIKSEMERLGITKDTLLIVYGDDQTPAARFGIIAQYMGVEDVRLINGGLKAWSDAGYPIATEYIEPAPVEYFGADTPLNPNLIIDHSEAKEYLIDEDSDLVSIRSWKEYTGATSGYDYISARGRIKGSKWGMAGTDPWHLEDYRAIDEAHMRPYNELADMWDELKIDTHNNLAFYCGTGWRASEVWFYAKAMGLDESSIYDGGWNEWSTTEDTKDDFLRGIPESLNEEDYLD